MQWFIKVTLMSALLVMMSSCENVNLTTSSITESSFGEVKEGQSVKLYSLVNENGLSAQITNYGGIVTSLQVPDKNGNFTDVVAGYNSVDKYIEASPYFGCLVGRYGNRIANGKFSIDGQDYTLATNNGKNSLHGGLQGFDKVVWEAQAKNTPNGPSLELTYLSPDGEEGFPGSLQVKAVYTLTNDNELKLEFTASTDKTTPINLTHHSYFNLAGPDNGDILDHEVTINADTFTPVNEDLIPLGIFQSVKGTPFDFTKPQKIGARINSHNTQLKFGGGYDHNWVINRSGEGLAFMAKVREETSGRVMEVFSTDPGLQFYTGNFLDSTNTGKNGKAYKHRSAFCMEPQHYPDSPNHKNFPSTLLSPGETYKHTIVYKFSVQK